MAIPKFGPNQKNWMGQPSHPVDVIVWPHFSTTPEERNEMANLYDKLVDGNDERHELLVKLLDVAVNNTDVSQFYDNADS